MVIGPLPPPVMGPSVATEVILAAFRRAGVDVVHVNTQDRRAWSNVGVFDARNAALALYHAAVMAWKAARHRVDFVYVPISQGRWGYVRDALLMTIARVLGLPIVVHLRGASFQEFFRSSTPLERFLIRRTLKWSARAIALTPALRSVYGELVPGERVTVLEEAISDPWPEGMETLRLARRERATRSPEALRILFVANDFAMKGAPTLVRALAEPGLEQATVRMVGDPPDSMARTTEDLARDLGVRERIELLGGLTGGSKWREFEQADVFAYPTENDAQPLVVLEAMAAGLPVVAAAVGGVRDTLEDAGLVVEPRDRVGLARALRSLIDEPELRDRLGVAARDRFLTRYTRAAFQGRFESVLRELAGGDSG